MDTVILPVSDTRAKRESLRLGFAALSSAFPMQTRDVLAAVSAGRLPETSGVVVL